MPSAIFLETHQSVAELGHNVGSLHKAIAPLVIGNKVARNVSNDTLKELHTTAELLHETALSLIEQVGSQRFNPRLSPNERLSLEKDAGNLVIRNGQKKLVGGHLFQLKAMLKLTEPRLSLCERITNSISRKKVLVTGFAMGAFVACSPTLRKALALVLGTTASFLQGASQQAESFANNLDMNNCTTATINGTTGMFCFRPNATGNATGNGTV